MSKKDNKNDNKAFSGGVKETLAQSTDTLWQNEVIANKFVARILIYTAVIALVVLGMSVADIFTINTGTMIRNLGMATAGLVVPAGICMYYKGEKKWLKLLMMLAYIAVLAQLHMVLGHNIVLCLVFPVILSVRYCSWPLTSLVSTLTAFSYLFVSYYGITHGITRMDLNMVEMPPGSILNFHGFTELRNAIDPAFVDKSQLFIHFLQHSFLPKLILFTMIAAVCAFIADNGRRAILAQKKETEKTQRLATELSLASAIQSNVLPSIFPVFPERNEFELYASMTPAKEVGGDFYDFFFVDDDHIALVMADVAGKGIPAALFMMVARTLIKNRAMMGGTPSEILHDVNNQLCEGNVANLFVTVWLGILEISTGKGISANAGHEHPVVRKKNDEHKLDKYKHSLAVAVMDGMIFRDHEFVLEPGDSLFVYTDGVPEATNGANELFGTDRMLEALNKDPDAMPDKMLENVMDGINDFVKGEEQFDDITMLALKYYGPKQ